MGQRQINIVRVDYGNPQHGSDLVLLLDSYARDPMGGGEPLSQFVKDNLVAELSKRDFGLSLIAYVDNQPAGLLNAFEGFSTFACKPLFNVHDIVVLEAFRGLQLSQLLLQELEKIARDKGCCKITLEVLEGNVIAQQAYQKSGFAGYELDPQMGKAMFWQKKLL
ncbi:GNAT family N-acetyltransferase [Cellvibrio sp. UBA7671]|uniref:GNAT family N-acetyltransferase n=1 Tax=Cellvibrio sp. UBA7671 TaxID=1946312 RepID=UPI002F34F26D